MREGLTIRIACVCVALAAAAGGATAGSTNLYAPVADDIQLTDGVGSPIAAGVVDVFEDGGSEMILNLRATTYNGFYETGHELTLHNADGSFVRSLASSSGTAFKSFVCKEGADVYYGLQDDIYRVGYAGGATGTVAAMNNHYDMRFDSTGRAFAVGNPGWAGNHIWLMDLTGGNSHTVVVQNAGVYSAELALDADDNLYYGTSGSGANELRTFTAAQINAAIGGGTALDFADGTHLTDLELDAGGIEVDDAGNVVFTMNAWGGPHRLAIIEDGASYTGTYQYDVLTSAAMFTTSVDALGDVMAYEHLAGDAAFTVGGGVLTQVPEPATAALLLGGLAALRRRRRRR